MQQTEVVRRWLVSGGRLSLTSPKASTCLEQLWIWLFPEKSDRDFWLLHMKATVAIYSSILLWVGGWSLSSPSKLRVRSEESTATDTAGSESMMWLVMSLIGTALAFSCDSLYGVMGGDGHWSRPGCFSENKVVWSFRLLAAIASSFAIFVGYYNLIDAGHWWTDWYGFKFDLVCWFGGAMLMALTNTLYWMAYIYPDDYYDLYKKDPCYQSNWIDHSRYIVSKVIPSLIGQNLFWVGSYNLLENHDPPNAGLGWWREVAYCAIGVLLLLSTGAYIPSSWIPSPPEEDAWIVSPWKHQYHLETNDLSLTPGNGEDAAPRKRNKAPWNFRFKALLALMGQCMNNTGAWTILDAYMFKATLLREVMYVVVGAFGIWITGAFEMNWGLTKTESICTEEEDNVDSVSTDSKLPPTISFGFDSDDVQDKVALAAVKSVIPDDFAIVDNDVFEGKKIIALRSFKAGEVLYNGHAHLLNLSHFNNRFVLQIFSSGDSATPVAQYENSDTHSVLDYAVGSEPKRQVYGWDGFMNHSCSPNAHFPLNQRSENDIRYDAIALKDINAGDEVTCDYACFDYRCDGHEIEVCACGAPSCRGRMMGFQGLSLKEQVDILHLVDEEVREKFVEDNNVAIFESSTPKGVAIRVNKHGQRELFATLKFESGDLLFTNQVEIINEDDVRSKIFVLEMKLNGAQSKCALLDPSEHFIRRRGYSEMLFFDSFMNHSCAPNTSQVYHDKKMYSVTVKETILPGDQITCDYGNLENGAVGLTNTGDETFQCFCGEEKCRGLITA